MTWVACLACIFTCLAEWNPIYYLHRNAIDVYGISFDLPVLLGFHFLNSYGLTVK